MSDGAGEPTFYPYAASMPCQMLSNMCFVEVVKVELEVVCLCTAQSIIAIAVAT